MKKIFFTIALASLSACSSIADVTTKSYQNNTNALYAEPKENKKHPAIVYMHGGAVRERGIDNVSWSLSDKVNDLSELGYVVLAPIRTTERDCCNGDKVIQEGIKVTKDAYNYLSTLPNVDSSKICLVGFSEGALISMWTMSAKNNYSSAIIMSPPGLCRMGRSGSKNYCARDLFNSGKLKKIDKSITLTRGHADHQGAYKVTKVLSKILSTKVHVLEGNHKSFTNTRTDVNQIIRDKCGQP